MAGHRKAKGRPTQHEARQSRMATRLASAATAEDRASAAFDWLRMTCAHATDKTAANAILLDVAAYLTDAERKARGGDSR
jgi:hypothetical protein